MTSTITQTASFPSRPSNAGTSSRFAARRAGPLALLVALIFLVTACGSGPGSQEEFIEVLVRNDAMTEEEAICISDLVFAEYADDEEALGKISAAPDFEYLDGEEGVPGFSDFFDSTVQSCSAVGPVPG